MKINLLKPFCFYIIFFSLLPHLQQNLEALSLKGSHQGAEKAMVALTKVPEFNEVVKKAEAYGAIKLEVVAMPNEQFEAFWDSTHRVIRINQAKQPELGSLITSILFELHNAASDPHFRQLYHQAKSGQLNKERYVEKVERMEHQNALNTCTILQKGIRLGYFPKEADWSILRSFDDHYKLQQLHGHSQWIANNFDMMFPSRQRESYIGTVPQIATLTQQDKHDMMRYLSIKNDLESPISAQARRGLQRLESEYGSIQGCLLGTSKNDCARSKTKLTLLKTVMKENRIFDTILRRSVGQTAVN